MTSDWRHTTTARLWLDLPAEADVDDLHAIHSDPDSWRHFPVGRHTSRAESEGMVTHAEGQFERNGLGYWSVREVPGGPVIGRGGCTIPTGRAWWNLYYRFATAVHGRGYATEMGQRAIEAARDVEPARPVRGLPAASTTSPRGVPPSGSACSWRGGARTGPTPTPTRSGWCTSTAADRRAGRGHRGHALGG